MNILARCTDAKGNEISLVGECKAQPGKRDVKRLVDKVKRL